MNGKKRSCLTLLHGRSFPQLYQIFIKDASAGKITEQLYAAVNQRLTSENKVEIEEIKPFMDALKQDAAPRRSWDKLVSADLLGAVWPCLRCGDAEDAFTSDLLAVLRAVEQQSSEDLSLQALQSRLRIEAGVSVRKAKEARASRKSRPQREAAACEGGGERGGEAGHRTAGGKFARRLDPRAKASAPPPRADNEAANDLDPAPISELATEANSGHNVYLAGSAGSGKTFDLSSYAQWRIVSFGRRSVAVTAMTGRAAEVLGCGACTLHSWSGIGTGDRTVPQIVNEMAAPAVKRWRAVDCLIVDEVCELRLSPLQISPCSY